MKKLPQPVGQEGLQGTSQLQDNGQWEWCEVTGSKVSHQCEWCEVIGSEVNGQWEWWEVIGSEVNGQWEWCDVRGQWSV